MLKLITCLHAAVIGTSLLWWYDTWESAGCIRCWKWMIRKVITLSRKNISGTLNKLQISYWGLSCAKIINYINKTVFYIAHYHRECSVGKLTILRFPIKRRFLGKSFSISFTWNLFRSVAQSFLVGQFGYKISAPDQDLRLHSAVAIPFVVVTIKGYRWRRL